MKYIFTTLILICFLSVTRAQISAGTAVPTALAPWKSAELMEPGELNSLIKSNKAPVILNIGTVEDIKGALHVGPVTDEANMAKLKSHLATHNKAAEVVIYCGCCPFGKCPNVRPAYTQLKEMGFNVRVLNLYVNLRNNWTAAGYPLAKD